MKTVLKLIAGFLIVLSHLQVVAQADSILTLPENRQVMALYTWSDKSYTMDSSSFEMVINQMSADFKKAGREDLNRIAWNLRNFYLISHLHDNLFRVINLIDEAVVFANRKDWDIQIAELYIRKGLVLRNHGKTVNSFEYLMKGYELMDQIGFDRIPRAQWYLYTIGISYYYVKAYDLAVVYLRKGLELPEIEKEGPEFLTGAYNTLGLGYMRQMKYDSAITAFKHAHQNAVDARMLEYTGLTLGNIGYAHFKLGDEETALPLLEEDFRISTETGEVNSAMNASLSLATIYLKKGLRDKAEYHMNYVNQHINRSDDRAMHSYYDNLSTLREIAGDYKSALAFRDSAFIYQERVQANEEKDILERARLELEIQKHVNELTSLEGLRRKQILLRNGLLLIITLTGILFLTLIQRRYQLRKRELEQAHKELTMFTDMIREKNELLDDFSHEIELMRATDQHTVDERSRHLFDLMNLHILTEDDWKQFRLLFDKVHPGFFVRLKEKMPDLTASEIRLLALTKLQLAPREMASMLGISYDSILKSRQRLRKKINLPEEGSLDELLKLI